MVDEVDKDIIMQQGYQLNDNSDPFVYNNDLDDIGNNFLAGILTPEKQRHKIFDSREF